MRLIWICLLSLGLYSQTQKAQIIQTYIYEIKEGDTEQKNEKDMIQIKIASKSLLDFMNADSLEDRLEKQVVRFHDAYTEFKASHRAIHSYSNSLNARPKFNFEQMIYELEYIGDATYVIKNRLKPIKDILSCRVMIQKTLSSFVDGKKDFVINLDNQHYYGKVLATHKYLQCTK